VVVTVTPARAPVVRKEFVRPGTHINAIGADAPGKQELDVAILQSAKVVVDNWEQASHGGEINVAVSRGLMRRGDIYAELGEIVIGRKPGRQDPHDVTVFDSTGLAIQDVACAAHVYRRLTSDPQSRAALRRIDFLSDA
jgi:alanine dehydrogenase